MDKTIHVKLIAKRSEDYAKYVFIDLETKEFILSVALPSWDLPTILLDDEGYADFEFAEAGKKYFNRTTEQEEIYRYDRIYLKNFVKENNNKDLNIV